MSQADPLPDDALPATEPGDRVALFGGSFNPPHISHALVAHSILLACEVDQLWVLPCADHPFGKGLAPFEDRMELCRLAFQHLAPRVRVVGLEALLPEPNFTVRTLRAIHAARPGLALKWVIGTDIVDELHLWREPEALPELCEMIIVPREGYARRGVLEFPIPGISSTEVRARVARDEDISGLVGREVVAHIEARGLYRAEPASSAEPDGGAHKS
jgi:nicotinate-nucleotide adenylyltransferase